MKKVWTLVVILMGYTVSLVQAGSTVIIQDVFTNMVVGSSVASSVLEVGSGPWNGTLIATASSLRVPDTLPVNAGCSIPLPEIHPGDIVSIKAEITFMTNIVTSLTWWGLGFSDAAYTAGTLGDNTPWATYTTNGLVTVYGGSGTTYNMGSAWASGSSQTLPTLSILEFIYDTGAETATTIVNGQTVHDNIPISSSGIPALKYAFFNFRNGPSSGTYLRSFEVSVLPERRVGTVIWDDFTGMNSNANISTSLPDAGLGTWAGSLVSDGDEFMKAPASSGNYGATVSLPEFNPGDIISVKATIGYGGGADWWGIGFSDKSYASGVSMVSNTPWANFRTNGTVVAFGGPSTGNNIASATRASGAVSGLFEIEFIYDTGAKTVTTIFDKEVVHDRVTITTGTPTLDYAFIYFYNPTNTYIDHFEVSVLPAVLTNNRGTVVFWDDFDTGTKITASTPEIDVEGLGWSIAGGADVVISNQTLIGNSNASLYAGAAIPQVGKYGVISISANFQTGATSSNWAGFGFGDGVHLLTTAHSGPWFRVSGDGTVFLYGGDGIANSSIKNIGSLPLNTNIEVKLTYDRDSNTASTWVNGAIVHDKVPVTNSSGSVCLDYALMQIKYAGEVSVDDVRVDLLPRREPLISLGEVAQTYTIFTNNDPAVNFTNIVNALAGAKAGSKPALVNFVQGTYVLDDHSRTNAPMIDLVRADNITIRGNNSTIEIRNPEVGFLQLVACSNIIVEGFKFKYDPLPFTQGIVTDVNETNGTIELQVDAGYPAPTNSWFTNAYRQRGWVIDDHVNGRLRDYCRMNYFYEDGITQVSGSANTYRIPISEDYIVYLSDLPEQSRFTLLARNNSASIFAIRSDSLNCTFRNIEIFEAPGVVNIVQDGEFINFINVNTRFDGSNWTASNGDQFHLQRARAVWVENCLIQGLSDDGINVYSVPAFVSTNSGSTYTLGFPTGDSFAAHQYRTGDRLLVVTPGGEIRGEVVILEVNAAAQTVTFDSGIAINTGSSLADASNIYDTDESSGFYLKNCTIRNSLSHGIRLRSRDACVDGTTFTGLGDRAVFSEQVAMGEGGAFNNVLLMNNRFINNGFLYDYQAGTGPAWGTVCTYMPADEAGIFRSGVRIYHNIFSNWRNAALALQCTENVLVSRNVFNGSIEDNHVSENVVNDLTSCSNVIIYLNNVDIRDDDVYIRTTNCINIDMCD